MAGVQGGIDMNKKEIAVCVGAAGTAFAANLAASAAPVISAASVCSGACGACGGGCIAGMGAVVWLSASAAYTKYKGGKNRE